MRIDRYLSHCCASPLFKYLSKLEASCSNAERNSCAVVMFKDVRSSTCHGQSSSDLHDPSSSNGGYFG
eukprot:7935851-Ditylum_brightwellii.AAC.1